MLNALLCHKLKDPLTLLSELNLMTAAQGILSELLAQSQEVRVDPFDLSEAVYQVCEEWLDEVLRPEHLHIGPIVTAQDEHECSQLVDTVKVLFWLVQLTDEVIE